MFEIAIYDVVLIPLIVGLVEIFKGLGLNKRFLPLISLTFGIAAGVFYVCPDDIKGGILIGIMLGLSASGLYSGTKHTIENGEK